VAEIAQVPGVGPELAQRVAEALPAGAADREPAVNMATGEVIG
jgi:excinuclease ABC subunit C